MLTLGPLRCCNLVWQSFALSEQPDICARATSLLTDVSRVMPRLLPAAQCVAVLSMPAVVSMYVVLPRLSRVLP